MATLTLKLKLRSLACKPSNKCLQLSSSSLSSLLISSSNKTGELHLLASIDVSTEDRGSSMDRRSGTVSIFGLGSGKGSGTGGGCPPLFKEVSDVVSVVSLDKLPPVLFLLCLKRYN